MRWACVKFIKKLAFLFVYAFVHLMKDLVSKLPIDYNDEFDSLWFPTLFELDLSEDDAVYTEPPLERNVNGQ